MKLSIFNVGLEENTDKTCKSPETEMVIYARVADYEGLKSAVSKETHEQVDSKFITGQRCRMRKTVKGDDVIFEVTIKKALDESNGVVLRHDEYTQEVDQSFFGAFTNIAGTSICYKDRFVFVPEKTTLDIKSNNSEPILIEVPLIKYEVDVFRDKDGVYNGWCKIDVELDGIQAYINEHYPEIRDIKVKVKVTQLPFKPHEIMLGDSESNKAKIAELWENTFTTKLR